MRHTFVVGAGLALLLLFVSPVWAVVNCTPDEITLSTQEDVDNFQTNHGPGCDTIVKKLTVSGAGITDLTPLSGLTTGAASPTWSTMSITGTSVTSLTGLDNLSSTYWFELINNASLIDLSALASLTDVQGPLFIDDNSSLTNLTGLSGVTSLPFGSLFLSDNPMLSDLGALSGLTSVGGSVTIWNNDALQNLDGLNGLNTVNGSLQVIQNDGLVNIDALAGVTNYSGTFELRFNSKLVTIPDFTGWKDLNGLIVYFNSALTDLDGLAGLQTVGNQYNVLWVKSNASLTNLDGLADLIGIETGLEVEDNPLLADCSGLVKVLDQSDDGQPGPGPGSAGIPDIGTEVTIGNNLPGCNSIVEITGEAPPPDFELILDFGGMDAPVGARSLANPDKSCGWESGETVEIWWDDPAALMATTTVDANGCFSVLFRIDSEKIGASTTGSHMVEARGNVSGTAGKGFEQVAPQLHLFPSSGAPGREVNVSGCNWDVSSNVEIRWVDDDTLLGTFETDQFGCMDGTIKLPREKDGLYGLVADDGSALFSGAAFEVISPNIMLKPPEGPAGAKVPLSGCNWFPNEAIEFAFQADGQVFDAVGTSEGGCITTNSEVEPALAIPPTAPQGEWVITATGQLSNLKVNTPFVVLEPTLVFTPANGRIGDPIEVSGCGWVGNDDVTVEWGHLDHNNLPIRWRADVNPVSGCFGENGDLVINVPSDSTTGPIENSASGNNNGEAIGAFTVNHPGWVEATNPNGYAGQAITLRFHDAIPGETLGISRFGSSTPLVSVTAPGSEFSVDVTLPTSYSAHITIQLRVSGTKGFSASVEINILDNAEISVPDPDDVRLGRSLRVEGRNWSSFESVRFSLRRGTKEVFLFPVPEVPSSEIDFNVYLDLPDSLEPGDYLLYADGNRDRDAELNVTVRDGPPTSFTLGAAYADPPPDLDGILSSGEWEYEQRVDLPNGFITARSDESRLYLLLDVLGDSTGDSLGADNFWLTFDTNRSRTIDAGIDLNFRLQGSDLIVEQYIGPDNLDPLNRIDLRSAYAAGFNCFSADDSARIEFQGTTTQFICDKHRIFEIGIDLHDIFAQPGETVRIGVLTKSNVPTFSDELPAGFPSDFSELGTILLAESQLEADPPDGTVTGIGSGGFEVEVTQAIQDANNSLKLISGKDTVARVYPTATGDALLRTYLFGRSSGTDLPGSPLVSLDVVPDAIDRETLADTVNFRLPDSWVTTGILDLTTVVEMPDGSLPKAREDQVIFRERRTPEIWVFPFNMGDAINSVLPRDSHMTEQEQALERLLPTPEVHFLRRDWTELNHGIPTVPCPAVDTVGNNDDKLDPGEILVCNHTYTIKQEDVDRGSFGRSAFAAGNGGATRSGRASLTVNVPTSSSAKDKTGNQASSTHVDTGPSSGLLASASAASVKSSDDSKLDLTLTSDFSTFKDAGDKIAYEFSVTSTGTDPVVGPITVADSEVGINLGTMKQDLRSFWNATYQAKAMTNDTASMPDQLYGFKVFGDPGASGTSHPVWLGGGGRVIVGRASGSNFDTATMVHELNHNLDRSTDGTWGRHVADPDDNDNTSWGCGAGGVDPAWPYSDDSVQETGFDTTLPWDDGSVDHLSIVPDSRDDFMSYCTDPDLPVAWISPYRWEKMYTVYSPAILFRTASTANLDDVFYVSGQVYSDGSGVLEPVFTLPGVEEASEVDGAYSIELQDLGGTPVYTMPFMASFIGVEGNSLEIVGFSFRLPYFANVKRVVLKLDDTVLHTIEQSANPPSLSVTAPTGGDTWQGEEIVDWQADDLDADDLQFSLFYTPNSGGAWHPVASRLSAPPFNVNVANLPGGQEGKILIVASDGLNTVIAESAGLFEVPPPDPIVVIHSPLDESILTPRQWIDLRGSASTPNGLDESFTFVWFVNGEIVEIGRAVKIMLEEGLHTIVLQALNEDGSFGETSVDVNVKENDPPNEPTLSFPAAGGVNVFLNSIMLNWIGGDIDGDNVTYDVYIEPDNPEPSLILCEATPLSQCLLPGPLQPATLYFWKVIARDEHGLETTGAIWSFETGEFDIDEVIFYSSFE